MTSKKLQIVLKQLERLNRVGLSGQSEPIVKMLIEQAYDAGRIDQMEKTIGEMEKIYVH